MSKGGLGKTKHAEVPAGSWKGPEGSCGVPKPRASSCCPGKVKSKNSTHCLFCAVTIGHLPTISAPP